MKKLKPFAALFGLALCACGGEIETASECVEEGGILQTPPGSCPSGFVNEGTVQSQGELATCCLQGDRSDVKR